ncbi:hypothetical protein NLN92_21345 [Citrobacter portucalensis]|uniref:hypothetical protein n=1 Tax=Citrobacter portucalensis TaxID=1639133 RepID=UPI00226B8B3A|nr:hypothetical protein [Citrobacter portucalensis]MCX8980551.1 hypothetical protein [Citrobacter portucalensis]
MNNYPRAGERWQHKHGWTVVILSVKTTNSGHIALRSEFHREVIYRYDSDNKVTESPLSWFMENYSFFQSALKKKPYNDNTTRAQLPDSVPVIRWRELNSCQQQELDSHHYSNYL